MSGTDTQKSAGSRVPRSAVVALLAVTCAGRVWPQNDTTAARETTPASSGRSAVVVEEEDIFGEINRQGLSIDGAEASILEGRPADTAAALPDTAGAAGDSAAVPAPAVVPAAVPDTTPGVPPPPGMEGRRSGRYGKYGPSAAPPGPPPAEAPVAEAVDTVPAGPAVVEAPRSVNFAKNLKEYRSPKLAMLLSLLVPGVGQAYARNYWKSAIFGVLEATVIGFSIAYNVKGKHELEDARSFADKHYDPGRTRFEQYYTALFDYFRALEPCHTDTNYDAQREVDLIYWRPDTTQPYLDYYRRERDAGSNTYYDWIGTAPYVQGWDDCVPLFEEMLGASAGQVLLGQYQVHPHVDEGCDRPDSAFLVYILPDTTNVYFGYSPNQHTYNDMVSTANASYRTSKNVLLLLLLNHIASAIDAGITAKRHNDRMLGKQTLWDRLHLVPQTVYSGSEMAPGYALLVDF